MFLVGMLSWWYTGGWKGRLVYAGRHLQSVAAFFSIGQLATTLFAPFRQISAGGVRGGFSAQLQAFFDKLISRIIGAVIRTLFIIAGIVLLVLLAVWEIVMTLLWLVVPALPVVGCIMAVIGWMPWK